MNPAKKYRSSFDHRANGGASGWHFVSAAEDKTIAQVAAVHRFPSRASRFGDPDNAPYGGVPGNAIRENDRTIIGRL